MSATYTDAPISIKERKNRMIELDAILTDRYLCKGRNYECFCDGCKQYLPAPSSLKKMTKETTANWTRTNKKPDWKSLIQINGNIKGGKAFIRREFPKYINLPLEKLPKSVKLALLEPLIEKTDQYLAEVMDKKNTKEMKEEEYREELSRIRLMLDECAMVLLVAGEEITTDDLEFGGLLVPDTTKEFIRLVEALTGIRDFQEQEFLKGRKIPEGMRMRMDTTLDLSQGFFNSVCKDIPDHNEKKILCLERATYRRSIIKVIKEMNGKILSEEETDKIYRLLHKYKLFNDKQRGIRFKCDGLYTEDRDFPWHLPYKQVLEFKRIIMRWWDEREGEWYSVELKLRSNCPNLVVKDEFGNVGTMPKNSSIRYSTRN